MTGEPARWRRGLAVATVSALLLVLAGYVVAASAAMGRMRAARPVALVAAWRIDPASVAPTVELSDVTIRTAIGAQPLDPLALNVAAVRSVAQGGEQRLRRWVPVLARMGWRDTPTLLNRLYLAARQADMPQVLDLTDGLMRRRQMQDQIMPVLSLVETEPTTRPDLVRRLVGNPGWRSLYLYSTGHLREPAQLQARYELLRQLEQRGVRLGRNEIASNVRAMVAGGFPERGFALWAGTQPRVARPLNDPRFAGAGTAQETSDETVPFEWETTAGNGFDVGAFVEDGRSALEIQWDGRGVPVFARQRTSALAGRQRIDVDVAPENVNDLSGLRFQLICGTVGYVFRQQSGRPTRFVTDEVVPCSFPILEIAGDIQSRAVPRRIELRGLSLTRVVAAGRS